MPQLLFCRKLVAKLKCTVILWANAYLIANGFPPEVRLVKWFPDDVYGTGVHLVPPEFEWRYRGSGLKGPRLVKGRGLARKAPTEGYYQELVWSVRLQRERKFFWHHIMTGLYTFRFEN